EIRRRNRAKIIVTTLLALLATGGVMLYFWLTHRAERNEDEIAFYTSLSQTPAGGDYLKLIAQGYGVDLNTLKENFSLDRLDFTSATDSYFAKLARVDTQSDFEKAVDMLRTYSVNFPRTANSDTSSQTIYERIYDQSNSAQNVKVTYGEYRLALENERANARSWFSFPSFSTANAQDSAPLVITNDVKRQVVASWIRMLTRNALAFGVGETQKPQWASLFENARLRSAESYWS